MIALFRLVSLRHLRRHFLRTALTTLGIVLGVGAVVAIQLVNESVLIGIRKSTEQVAGKAQLVVFGDRSGMPEELLEKVRKVPGVRHVAPIIRQVALVRRVNGKPAGGRLQIFAVDALDDRSIPDSTFKRDDLEIEDPVLFLNKPSSLIVAHSFAERHGILDQADKATVSLATSRGVLEFTVRGFLKSEVVEKTFGGSLALMDVYSAQRVFGKDGKLDELNVLLPKTVSDADRDRIRSRIVGVVGPGYEVERPFNRGRQSERLIATWQSGQTVISFITLFVGMFLIYNTVSFAVAERRTEIGILRALGATRTEIATMFATEALFMGLVGAGAGIALGIAGTKALLRVNSEILTSLVMYTDLSEVQLAPATIALGIVLGAAAALVSALAPSLGAARVSPLEAIGRTSGARRRRRGARRRHRGGPRAPCDRRRGTRASPPARGLLRGLCPDRRPRCRLRAHLSPSIVALLGLLNTLLIAILERTREIGVMRAIGTTRAQIAGSIVVESALMGLGGTVLGVGFGAALGYVDLVVISAVQTGWEVDFVFDALAAVQLCGISLVVAAIAAYLPARRAARQPIPEALEYE